MKEYLEVLRLQPEFIALIAQIKEERPIIPVYTHNPDNTDEWKANSNMQKGFNLCLHFLGENDD